MELHSRLADGSFRCEKERVRRRGRTAIDDFETSRQRYEAGLRDALGADFYAPDLKRKHRKMAEGAFQFLRGTCWRWAECAEELVPELFAGPAAPSVGDAHAGNFGLWRDSDARLVWGLSDYDEAARLPWALDLVRLCASLLLADRRADAGRTAATAIAGYRAGLSEPAPFVLDLDNLWLRKAFAAKRAEREQFWEDLIEAKPELPPPAFEEVLRTALPEAGLDVRFARRTAGTGSLGRARWIAVGAWRGGPVAAEAKSALPSCWVTAREPGLADRMAAGRWRSPDPTLVYGDHQVVRRIAPNSRKLDFEDIAARLQARLIAAMAAELAMVQADTPELPAAILADLEARPAGWLAAAADRVAQWTRGEHEAYRKRYRRKQ